jgi:hypothetical protein
MPRRVLGTLLIGRVAVGSVVPRIGIPVGSLYVVSELLASTRPSIGPWFAGSSLPT